METARHDLNLLDLDNLILRQILGFLSRKELMTLRIVSKEMRNLAELKLMSRKDKLMINDSIKSVGQGKLVTRLHRNIVELQVKGPLSERNDLFKIIDFGKEQGVEFPLLQRITLSDCNCNNSSISLVAFYWRNITFLSLNKMDIDDNGLSVLLQKLNNLETLSVKNLMLTGIFLSFIGKNVTTIEWETCHAIRVEQSFSTNGKGNQISEFSFRYLGGGGSREEGRKIVSLISKEFGYLKELDLDVELDESSLGNLNALKIKAMSLQNSENMHSILTYWDFFNRNRNLSHFGFF